MRAFAFHIDRGIGHAQCLGRLPIQVGTINGAGGLQDMGRLLQLAPAIHLADEPGGMGQPGEIGGIAVKDVEIRQRTRASSLAYLKVPVIDIFTVFLGRVDVGFLRNQTHHLHAVFRLVHPLRGFQQGHDQGLMGVRILLCAIPD